MPFLKTRINGVSFSNDDGSSRQEFMRALTVGEAVTLRREWANEFDPNAIAVHTVLGQIGYVPADVAAKLARLDYGWTATVVARRGGSEQAPTLGAEISIQVRSTP